MDIQSWFSDNGSYADGVKLYSLLPNCNGTLLRSFSRESSSNFLKLKYELKKASYNGSKAIVPKVENIATEPEKVAKEVVFFKDIILQSEKLAFEKETMAMYPMELHSTYRQRVSDFYLACELKFQLNSIPANDEELALKIIMQLEDLWTRIDRAWMILNHWKDHNRLISTEESEDFSKLSGVQLVMLRNKLESRISKRQKTIESIRVNVDASPEDKGLLNLFNRKFEQLQQLIIDLETVRKLLKNE